jgi:hypothetical protein
MTRTSTRHTESLVHPLKNIKIDLPDDQVAAISMIRTHSTDVFRQRLECLEKILAISDGLMPMSDVIRASAPSHVVEASGEASNSPFAAALIIAIDRPDVFFARGHFL